MRVGLAGDGKRLRGFFSSVFRRNTGRRNGDNVCRACGSPAAFRFLKPILFLLQIQPAPTKFVTSSLSGILCFSMSYIELSQRFVSVRDGQPNLATTSASFEIPFAVHFDTIYFTAEPKRETEPPGFSRLRLRKLRVDLAGDGKRLRGFFHPLACLVALLCASSRFVDLLVLSVCGPHSVQGAASLRRLTSPA